MKIKLLVILVLYYNITFSAECFKCDFHDSIYSDLSIYQNNKVDNMIKNGVNIFWPSCEDINEKRVLDTSIINDYSYECWIPRFLKKYDLSKLIYLINMQNGDDWIIGWHAIKELYVQYIDGRTLTILIKLSKNDEFSIVNVDNLFQLIYKKTNKIINFYNMALDENSYIYIQHQDSLFIEGYFDKTYNDLSSYKRDYIWTNGKYVIIEIVKIGYPYRIIKGEMYQVRYIINGIQKNDKRSFTRFRKEKNIDLKEEMYKIFPWMKDSIEYYQKNQSELNGVTPVYILDKK